MNKQNFPFLLTILRFDYTSIKLRRDFLIPEKLPKVPIGFVKFAHLLIIRADICMSILLALTLNRIV